jgi:hypothetical protein
VEPQRTWRALNAAALLAGPARAPPLRSARHRRRASTLLPSGRLSAAGLVPGQPLLHLSAVGGAAGLALITRRGRTQWKTMTMTIRRPQRSSAGAVAGCVPFYVASGSGAIPVTFRNGGCAAACNPGRTHPGHLGSAGYEQAARIFLEPSCGDLRGCTGVSASTTISSLVEVSIMASRRPAKTRPFATSCPVQTSDTSVYANTADHLTYPKDKPADPVYATTEHNVRKSHQSWRGFERQIPIRSPEWNC